MKLLLDLLVDLEECVRVNNARPHAMHPMMESVFHKGHPKEGEPHDHCVKITSTGFQFLAEMGSTIEGVKECEGISHFAFRNAIVFIVRKKELQMGKKGFFGGPDLLDEESCQKIQIFLVKYLATSWDIDQTIAVNVNRLPIQEVNFLGEDWVAFPCQALLPCSEEEWIKTLEARQTEIKWAEIYLGNKRALADVKAAEVLRNLGSLH